MSFAEHAKEWLKLRRRDFDRVGVSSPLVLAVYNAIANGGDDRKRALLFGRSHRNLFGRPAHFAWRRWPVRDRRVAFDLPLRDQHAGFDWARALGALAHDIEVKQVYRFLIDETPKGLFIDIGANYGQHSHYFMAAGWDVWSFEPNALCRDYHESVCALNQWSTDQWREVALSDSAGAATLRFPEGEEYLGSIEQTALPGADMTMAVQRRTLSSFFNSVADAVIKIDVEGHERQVLGGFPPDLPRVRCLFFEALNVNALAGLRGVFEAVNLDVLALARDATFIVEGAIERGVTNFAAVPAGSAVHCWLTSRMAP